MQKIKHIVLSVFFLLGERLALVLIIVIAAIVIVTKQATPAFSESEQINKFIPQQSSNVSFSIVPQTNSPMVISSRIEHLVAPSPTPSPTATPTPKVNADSDDVWDKLAECESHKNWSINTGNGYFGGLQFNQGAWEAVGGSGKPSDASREEQISRAKLLQAKRGWGAWGGCAKSLGLL